MNYKRNIELEIILKLLKRNYYLRELSKELKEPLTNISRKIKLLEKKKIIDFESKGRNKQIFLKDNILTKAYILMAENYNLIKFLEKNPKFKAIINEIRDFSKSQLIIIFGSYAKGLEIKKSDLDIFVEKDLNSKSEKRKLEEIHRILSIKEGEFDKNSNLIKEIIEDHIIIKGVERFYEKVGFFKKT